MYRGLSGLTQAGGGGMVSLVGMSNPVTAAFTIGLSILGDLASFIGAGRREADVITPVQNSVQSRLAQIDAAVGHDAMGTEDMNLLQTVLNELQTTGGNFLSFLRDPRFTDGRASGQAANTIMPILDGTGGYGLHASGGGPVSLDAWGNPTNNGARVGAVIRRILQLGGQITPPQIVQYAGTAIPTLPPSNTLGVGLPQSSAIPYPSAPTIGGGLQLTGAGQVSPLLLGAGLLAVFLLRRGKN